MRASTTFFLFGVRHIFFSRNKWQRNQDVGHKITFRVYMYIFMNLTTLLPGAQDRIHRDFSDFIPTTATLRWHIQLKENFNDWGYSWNRNYHSYSDITYLLLYHYLTFRVINVALSSFLFLLTTICQNRSIVLSPFLLLLFQLQEH